jgi:hypothetical protein
MEGGKESGKWRKKCRKIEGKKMKVLKEMKMRKKLKEVLRKHKERQISSSCEMASTPTDCLKINDKYIVWCHHVHMEWQYL